MILGPFANSNVLYKCYPPAVNSAHVVTDFCNLKMYLNPIANFQSSGKKRAMAFAISLLISQKIF